MIRMNLNKTKNNVWVAKYSSVTTIWLHMLIAHNYTYSIASASIKKNVQIPLTCLVRLFKSMKKVAKVEREKKMCWRKMNYFRTLSWDWTLAWVDRWMCMLYVFVRCVTPFHRKWKTPGSQQFNSFFFHFIFFFFFFFCSILDLFSWCDFYGIQ